MQKQNGYKLFEREFTRRGKLNTGDLMQLKSQFGITKEQAVRYDTYLRKNDLSIIPSEDEKTQKSSKTQTKK